MCYSRLISFFLISSLFFAISSCHTTIPETDTEKPHIMLLVKGPGIGSQTMTNPPKEQWTAEDGTQFFNLKSDSTYKFVLKVTDQGGVKRATFAIPTDIEISEIEPAGYVIEDRGISRYITINGSRSAPKTALILSGKMTMPNYDVGFALSVEADDFGGRSGITNQRFMIVEVYASQD